MRKKWTVQQVGLITGLFSIVFVTGMDSFIISPLLPVIQREFRVNLATAAQAVSLYAACYAVGAPIFGPVSDRYDRRNVLGIGLGIFSLGSVACALAPTMAAFDVSRAITGLGAALTLPSIWALIGQTFTGRQLRMVMGTTMSALSLAIAIGVPLGTWCAQLTNWRVVFWISTSWAVVAGVVSWTCLPTLVDHRHLGLRWLTSLRRVGHNRQARLGLLVTLTWMSGFYLLYTFLGTFVTRQFGWSTGRVGLLFMIYGIGNFLASILGGRLTQRWSTLSVVVSAEAATGLITLILAIEGRQLVVLGCMLLLLALVQGLGVPALSTFLVNVAPRQRGTLMACNSACLYAGLTLAGVIGGPLYPVIGYAGLCTLAAGAAFVAVGLLNIIKKESKNN